MCPPRPAHSALRVRLVQVTPASNVREPGRWHRTQPRARDRRCAARAELLIPHVATVRWEGAHSAAAHKHARYTHTHPLATHTRAKTQSDGNAQTRTCAHNGTRASTDARARTQRARTQMRTNTQMNTYTNSHANCTHTHTHMLARTRAPKDLSNPVHPRYPLVPPSTPAVPPRCPLVPPSTP